SSSSFFAASSINLSRSYSRRRLALYTWNSPLPAPADEPCTLATISGGAGSEGFDWLEGDGRVIGFCGSRNKFWIWCAWEDEGVLAPRARLRGRCERGSAEVGMDSGMGSDILEILEVIQVVYCLLQ